MTLSSTANRNDYTGTGTTDTYNYSFRILAETDLLVTIRDTDDIETAQVLNTDYTVTGVGEQNGGTIVLTAGNLTTDYVLTIRRVRPLTQTTDIRNQGDFYPEGHEDEFDSQIMVDQQQQDELDRSIKLAETVSSAGFDPTLPTDIADKALYAVTVNAAGDGFSLSVTSDAVVSIPVLENNVYFVGRNAANSANIDIVKVNTSDKLDFGTDAAVFGMINNTFIHARNAANSADINMIKVNAADDVEVGTAIQLPDEDPAVNGQIGWDSVQGFLGYTGGSVGPLGGDVSWKILDNDAAADGTVIVKAGTRWINGIQETHSADFTAAAPSTGSDDTIRTLDGSTGLRYASSATIRNHIYWDTINDGFVTISNASTADQQKYDSTTRTINTIIYAPVGYIDIAESGGAYTLSNLTNYPIQSWDSFHQLQAADGFDDTSWTPTFTPEGSLTYGSTTINESSYRRVGNRVEVQIQATGTLGGSADNGIDISLPIAAKTLGQNTTVGVGTINEAGTQVGAIFNWETGDNTVITLRKANNANFATSGTMAFSGVFSYEINASNGFNPIATPAMEFNSNIQNLTIQSSIGASDPIGSLYFYEYQSTSSNTRTLVSSVTQTTSDMNTNGIRLYARAYNAANTSGQPGAVGVKIGTVIDPKSIHVYAFSAAAKVDGVTYEQSLVWNSDANQQGLRKAFDRDTGILWIDVGNAQSSSNTTRQIGVVGNDNVAATSAYFEIIASGTTPSVGLPQQNSKVKVEDGNGHGSTNNKIRRFTTTTSSVGPAITYADSAANGGSFTINQDGIYAISYTDIHTGAAHDAGISLNGSALTTAIGSLADSERLAYASAADGTSASVAWIGRLAASDIIRAHTSGVQTATSAAVAFSIEKVNF